jgi:hypothetical protein
VLLLLLLGYSAAWRLNAGISQNFAAFLIDFVHSVSDWWALVHNCLYAFTFRSSLSALISAEPFHLFPLRPATSHPATPPEKQPRLCAIETYFYQHQRPRRCQQPLHCPGIVAYNRYTAPTLPTTTTLPRYRWCQPLHFDDIVGADVGAEKGPNFSAWRSEPERRLVPKMSLSAQLS